MSEDTPLQQLLAPMTERAVELDTTEFRVDRERVLARMADAGRSERQGRLGFVALAAAGALVFVGGATLLLHGALWRPARPARPAHPEGPAGREASLEVTVSLGSGTRVQGDTRAVVTPEQSLHVAATGDFETDADSRATVRAEGGLEIELGSQTRVTLSELSLETNRVKLLGGRIHCAVPHRPNVHAFEVVTRDVTVVDVGTVFTVTLEEPAHGTRVTVEEGEVLLRHALGETRVRAPGTWSSATGTVSAHTRETPESPRSDEPATALAPSPPIVRAPAKGSRGEPPAPALPVATLEQEAQLLRRGLAAERNGRPSEAISALTELVAKYPRSPLVPDAERALARVKAATRR